MKGREALHSVRLYAAGRVAIITEYHIVLAFKLILLSHRVSSVIPIPQSALFPLCACSLAVSPPIGANFTEATQSLKASFGTIATTEASQQNRRCLLQRF